MPLFSSVSTCVPDGGSPALGILEESIPAVDDCVARLQERLEIGDNRIGAGTGLDHQHDLAWPWQQIDQLLQ